MPTTSEPHRTALAASLSSVGIGLFLLSMALDGAPRALFLLAGLAFLVVGGGWSLTALQQKQREQQPPPGDDDGPGPRRAGDESEEDAPGTDVTPR